MSIFVKFVNIFVQINQQICPNCKMCIWWNNFKISCLCLSQLVGSTADVKTLPNGFFHISQSATSDFFWIFLYLMPQVFADTPPPLLQHTQILHKQENSNLTMPILGASSNLWDLTKLLLSACVAVFGAITSQQNVLYTVWPLTKDKKAFN